MTSLVVLANDAGVGLIILLLLYFIPAVVAFARGHHNKWPIFILNLLLGWTVLGWIGALIWAFTRPQPQIVRVVHEPAESPTAAPVDPPTES